MTIVVGISRGDAGEHVLIAFARQEIAVGESGLAENGQPGVPEESVTTRAPVRI